VKKYMKTRDNGVFRCPTDDSDIVRFDNIPASYRVNASNQPDAGNAYKITMVKKSTQSIFLCEANASQSLHHLATWESPFDPTYGHCAVSKTNRDNVAFKRHPHEMNNYLFGDGHGEFLAWDDTWKPIGLGPATSGRGGPGANVNLTMWRQLYLASPADHITPFKQDQ